MWFHKEWHIFPDCPSQCSWAISYPHIGDSDYSLLLVLFWCDSHDPVVCWLCQALSLCGNETQSLLNAQQLSMGVIVTPRLIYCVLAREKCYSERFSGQLNQSVSSPTGHQRHAWPGSSVNTIRLNAKFWLYLSEEIFWRNNSGEGNEKKKDNELKIIVNHRLRNNHMIR